jgi:hypothetical protein
VGTDQKSTVRRLGKKNLVSRHSGGLALVVLAVQPRRRVVLDHVTLVKVGLDRRRLQAPVCTVSVCLRRHSLTPNIIFFSEASHETTDAFPYAHARTCTLRILCMGLDAA